MSRFYEHQRWHSKGCLVYCYSVTGAFAVESEFVANSIVREHNDSVDALINAQAEIVKQTDYANRYALHIMATSPSPSE